jgi:GNAT superfamily N-acetyltransferase
MEDQPPTPAAGAIEIRPATLADLDELVAVYRSAAAHHVAIEPADYLVPTAADAAIRWQRRVESRGPDVECLVAVVDGRVVGSASVELMPSSGVGSMIRPFRMAELGIGLMDGYRGLGIGQRLIAAPQDLGCRARHRADRPPGRGGERRRDPLVRATRLHRRRARAAQGPRRSMTTFKDVRRIALALPEAKERLTWKTDITFRVRDKIFAIDGEGADRVSITAGLETQAELIELDPGTFAKAAYVGRFGWITVAGDWIRALRQSGFAVENLVELWPTNDATTTFPYVTHAWARQWPTEEVWIARREG